MTRLSTFFLAVSLLFAASAFGQTKRVFAHYMVCFTSYDHGSVEGYKHDIQDAQSLGIDGFALNSGAWDTNYQRNVARMFQAASELGTGFKLFISFDRCCGLTDAQIIDMAATYAKSPNYFCYNGRPFLSAWSGASPKGVISTLNIINTLKARGINVYFIPFMYTTDYRENPNYDQALQNYNAVWKKFCDGYYYFGAVGVPNKMAKASIINTGEALSKVFHENGKTFMASVSPEYWGDKQPTVGRRYYEYNGGEGLAAQWKSIMEVQKPEWIELATWNDWSEGTYFSPIADITQFLPELMQLHNEAGFFKSHAGFAELNKYYINWYKTGKKPAITKDQLFFFYRTNPKAVVVNDVKGAVSSLTGDIKDEIYLTTLLTAPAQLQVSSGGSLKTFNLPAGISNVRAPFSVGQQYFKVVRNGVAIASAQGENITGSPVNYDFDEYSGYAPQ